MKTLWTPDYGRGSVHWPNGKVFEIVAKVNDDCISVVCLFFSLWTDPADYHDLELVPKDVYNRMAIYRNRLIELGLKAEPIFPKYCAQNPDECI